jgi:hypothetical protein
LTSSRDTHAVSRRRISTRFGIAVAAFLLAFAGIGASAMAAAPTNDVLPEINDTTPQDGQTISTTTGDWSGGVDSYAYQWQTSPDGSTGWSDIGGATSFQFTVSGCQDYLRVRVTATNPDGSTAAFSLATSQVSCVGPFPGTATITGTEQVGQTLTGSTSGWTGSAPITYTYAWYVSNDSTCTTYSGTPYSTGTTYALPVSTPPWNRCIKLVVTATGPDGSTDTAETETDNIDGIAPSFSENPVISGIRRIGEKLFVLDNGTIDWGYPVGSQAISYIWEQNCPNRADTPTGWVPYQPNGGGSPTETGSTYTLQTYNRVPASGPNTAYNYPGDVNCDVRVEVKAVNGNDPARAVTVGDESTDDSNARGRIQRQYGNTYQVETAASFEPGADPGHWGQAPNLTDPTKPINDCLGPYNWNDDTVTAPYVPTSTATTNAQEACRQLQEAVNQNLNYTENGTSPVGQQISYTTPAPGSQLVELPAQSQRDGFTRISVGPSLDDDAGDTGFQGGALIQDFFNLLVIGEGRDNGTTITGQNDGTENIEVVCPDLGPVTGGNKALICIEDTNSYGRATNVTVRDMELDGNNASLAPDDYNETYTGVAYYNASGNVQNVDIFDFNGPSTIGNTGAGGRGVFAYRNFDDCDDPDRVLVNNSAISGISGPQSYGILAEGDDSDCTNLVFRLQDSFIDADSTANNAVEAGYDTRLRAVNNYIESSSNAAIALHDYTYGSSIEDNELFGNEYGVISFDQDPPDARETIDEDNPIEITGNEIDNALAGIYANDGVYSITRNKTAFTGIGMAIGPVGLDEFGAGTGSFYEVQAELIGNDITVFEYGVISTNDGIPGALDLTLTGNRIVSDYGSFLDSEVGAKASYFDFPDSEVGAEAGFFDGQIGLVNYYDPSWSPYNNDGDPPAGNLQVDPVDARNNWWGCSTGPTYNPTELQLEAISEEGFCNLDVEGNNGEVIFDGSLPLIDDVVPPQGGDNVDYDPWVDIDTDAGDKILRAQASEVPIGGDPTGETAEFFVDMSENSDGVKLQGDRIIPSVGIQYTLVDSTEVTDADLDRFFTRTSPVTAIANNYVTAGYETGELPVTLLADYELMSGEDLSGGNRESDLMFEVIRPDPSLFSGAGSPPSEIGQPGDFWFDTDANCLYGPKVGVGDWDLEDCRSLAGGTTLSGAGAPDNSQGNPGDFYFDTENYCLYGPKQPDPSDPTSPVGGVWPEDCESLWGGTVLSGSGPPSNTIGNPGDFYLDTTSDPECLYGPKGATEWPTRCIPIGGYPLPTVTNLQNQFRINKAGQSIATVRINCPELQIRCEVRRVRVVFQARNNLNGIKATARIGKTSIPAGGSTVVRANVPRKIFRQLARQRTGSVTTTVRVIGAGTDTDIARRSGIRR